MALPRKSLITLFSASLVLLFTVFCHPLFSDAADEQNKRNLEPEQALSLISAYSWTNTLPRELIDLQNEVETTADLETVQKRAA